MAIDSKFISFANVFHKRITPKVNSFNYNVFYICFDIEKINELTNKIFSINKFNLFSFYLKDHGKKDGSCLKKWADNFFNQHGINNYQRIFLHTHPRVLGYVFNPVSFWFAVDKNDQIIATICQVNNTFGETHCYLIHHKNGDFIQENQWFTADKEFHVSPFYKTEGQYKFRFIFNEKNIAIWIDYHLNDKTLLTNVISKKRSSFNVFNLVIAFLTIPFLTFKVILLIHWQAVKIFLKKIKYIPKPIKKPISITINKI
jgi:hypothetical protein